MKVTAVLSLTSAIFAATVSAQCQKDLFQPCGDSSRPREQNCCSAGYCMPWTATNYLCMVPPAKCPTQETDIDYAGNDLKTIKNGMTPEKCCDECAALSGCKAYTFVNVNNDGPACYLKSSNAGRKERKGAVSGALSGTPPTPSPNCGASEQGVDYVGNDMKKVPGLTQGACCDECSKTNGCKAYSWVEKSNDGKNDGSSMCYLKSSDAGRTNKAGVVSAKLNTVAPNPPATSCTASEQGVDYVGNDMKKVPGLTQGACCDECNKTNGCKAYSWVEKSNDGKNDGSSMCYLKSSDAGRTNKAGVVSAKVVQQQQCAKKVFEPCGSNAAGPSCCPENTYCQPWNPSYYQCVPAPNAAKCPFLVTGVDYYGGDLEKKMDLSLTACCEACDASNDCYYFTFIQMNGDGRSACYLKTKLAEQRARADAVSGYVNP